MSTQLWFSLAVPACFGIAFCFGVAEPKPCAPYVWGAYVAFLIINGIFLLKAGRLSRTKGKS